MDEFGRPTAAWQLDLTDADRCALVAEQVGVEPGRAPHPGVRRRPARPDASPEPGAPDDFARQMRGDAEAFFNITHACLPYLRESQGSIVAVTTAATTRFPVRDGLSTAPKAAVEALVRGIAAEEGRFGVRANCVGPGMITDGMAERLIASGDLDERALEVARANIALRRFGSAVRHRRGGLLPRQRPRRPSSAARSSMWTAGYGV